ncbi:hypothetical protein FYJ73_12755 [Prevotellaceae bacterium LKV-178-WT-2A]|uniref:Glycosyl hydrolase family 32 C-terminal domain-containing protein n=1 Tax=Hallella mizrahii TaxID=2606637 RepID=A0A7K0KJ70_9BACT|nr:hypothetical protein [Hallella mizrahii]
MPQSTSLATSTVRTIVDKCSIEIFVDGGRIAITNLVFSTQPYNNIKLYSKGYTPKSHISRLVNSKCSKEAGK